MTGRNKRAIEDHFDANNELETILRAKGKKAQADMVRKIIPDGVECIFVRQPYQLGLGNAVLCAERAVGGDPFAVLLADDFIADYEPGVTADLVSAYESSGKSQLSVIEVNGPEITKYGVVDKANDGRVRGLIEKPTIENVPSNVASIGRYVLTPAIFDLLRDLPIGIGGEIQLADAINLLAKDGNVEAVKCNGVRFDCGSIEGFIAATLHEYSKRSEI